MGLGLSICQSIIEAPGPLVGRAERVRGSAVFTFRLRRDTGAEVMANEPTVFVIDDDAAVRDSLRALLESVGLRAPDVPEADELPWQVRARSSRGLILDIGYPARAGSRCSSAWRSSGRRARSSLWRGTRTFRRRCAR